MISFWVEVILGKYRYHQPSNRYLTDLRDQGLPVSPGTLCGGLQKLTPLFEPIQQALYCKQMSEQLFHNDETRWEVFVEMEGKIGSLWYLWVTRSASVIYYCIDPSRSAAAPGAHFAGLQQDQVIIVCDRYSAYKKLARLSGIILLAFCWAHVRRDFLNAAKSFKVLEPWALDWKQQIGQLYHLNKLRLQQWNADLPILTQSPDFHRYHYLGHKTLPGAQLRYFVTLRDQGMEEHERLKSTRALLPDVLAAAEDIENNQIIPPHLMLALSDAGLFSVAVPRELGGPEIDPLIVFDALELLGTADASTAWVVLIIQLTTLQSGVAGCFRSV